MILTNELRGIIAMRGLSQAKVAESIGITDRTFYTKMKKGVFGSDEIEAMIELLKIEDPARIFLQTKSLNKRLSRRNYERDSKSNNDGKRSGYIPGDWLFKNPRIYKQKPDPTHKARQDFLLYERPPRQVAGRRTGQAEQRKGNCINDGQQIRAA